MSKYGLKIKINFLILIRHIIHKNIIFNNNTSEKIINYV